MRRVQVEIAKERGRQMESELREKIESATEALAHVQDRDLQVADLKKRLAEVEADHSLRVSKLQGELKEHKNKADEALEQVQEKDLAVADLTARLVELEADKALRMSLSTLQRTKLEEELKERSARVQTVEEEVKMLQRAEADAKKAVVNAEAAAAALRLELAGAMEMAAGLKGDKKDLEKALDAFRASASCNNTCCNTRTAQEADALRKSFEELDRATELSNTAEEALAQKQEKDLQMADLKKRLAEVEVDNALRMSQLEAERKERSARMHAMEQQVKKLQHAEADAKKEASAATEDQDAGGNARASGGEEEVQARRLQEEKDAAARDREVVEAERDRVVKEKDDALEEVRSLSQQLFEVRKTLEASVAEWAKKKEILEQEQERRLELERARAREREEREAERQVFEEQVKLEREQLQLERQEFERRQARARDGVDKEGEVYGLRDLARDRDAQRPRRLEDQKDVAQTVALQGDDIEPTVGRRRALNLLVPPQVALTEDGADEPFFDEANKPTRVLQTPREHLLRLLPRFYTGAEVKMAEEDFFAESSKVWRAIEEEEQERRLELERERAREREGQEAEREAERQVFEEQAKLERGQDALTEGRAVEREANRSTGVCLTPREHLGDSGNEADGNGYRGMVHMQSGAAGEEVGLAEEDFFAESSKVWRAIEKEERLSGLGFRV
jgi:hypothetical protein